jgi:phosphate transport system substrate-binding protein
MKKLRKRSLSLALFTFLGLALFSAFTGCKGETRVVRLDGSSTVFPVSEAVAEEFKKAKGINVTVGISGTGGGFKKFCRGEIDISDASRPILTEELTEARNNGIEFIELPICFDALTVVVNPKNDWVNEITVEELKKIWEPSAQAKITRWNQINASWPDQKLTLFGAGTDSGTYDYFTEAVVGKAKSCRGDFNASEDDNVLVTGIENDVHALGFIPYAYYEPHKTKLKALAIKTKADAKGVLPSKETVLDGSYTPLSRPLFIYVNKKSLAKSDVRQFVEFYLANVGKLCQEVKYVPLPDKAYEIGKERVQQQQTGSAFGGVPEVGLPIEEILKKTPKS